MKKTDKPEKSNNKKHFWKDFKAELKKVIWPTRSQVVNNTVIVLVIVIIVTALCFVLDLAFEALNTYGIDKLKSAVQNNVQNTVAEQNTVNDINETTASNQVIEDTNQINVDNNAE